MASKWLDWQPGQNISKTTTQEPSKPTKAGSDGFEGSYLGLSEIFSSAPSVSQDTIDAASKILNSVEARLWTDHQGNAYLGVWECVDSGEVRRAAALLFPEAKVLYLERPEVPITLKVMSAKITRIDQVRWKVWK